MTWNLLGIYLHFAASSLFTGSLFYRAFLGSCDGCWDPSIPRRPTKHRHASRRPGVDLRPLQRRVFVRSFGDTVGPGSAELGPSTWASGGNQALCEM